MSRHQLQPRADRPEIAQVFIGWDRPLQTFFIQVYDRRQRLRRWVGTLTEELRDPDIAIAMIARYAVVPPELKEDLERERADSAGEHDSPLQTMLKSAGVIR